MSVFDASMEPMVEMFIYETTTLLEQLDEILIDSEKAQNMTTDNINEIFRIMHTIKGSSAMMGLSSMSELAHHTEDMFFIVREDPSKMHGSLSGTIFDLLFQSSDFFKAEVEAIQENSEEYQPSDASDLTAMIADVIPQLKGLAPVKAPVIKPVAAKESTTAAAPSAPSAPAPQAVKPQDPQGETHAVRVFFEDGCQMENIRAFMLLTQLKDYCDEITSEPENPENNSACSSEIIKNGLLVRFKTSLPLEQISSIIENSVNIKSYEYEGSQSNSTASADAAAAAPHTQVVTDVQSAPVADLTESAPEAAPQEAAAQTARQGTKQSLISVNQIKLDQLMDVMGEIVIAESMVANNPELRNLHLDNFYKSTRQLRKLTDQLQDIVMSIRMVPLSGVFQKMNRIVRDMNKKLGKDVVLNTVGGETEVDKTINDVLADPFMHMIRNAMDHAIESPQDRVAAGKPAEGIITLSAQNVGGEIVITIADDGRGLDRSKILEKAKKNGLLNKPEKDYTEKEIFQLIMLPGFSTNEVATEFSGRGVGMDVVRKNIEKVNGVISIDSKKGVGTTFTVKIPLTLAIVDGMEVAVNNETFTIPITSIRQTFKLSSEIDLLTDTEGTEMVMLRGICFPVIRLHKIYNIDTSVTALEEGIFILVESDSKSACLFVDQLMGEQQVVVKPFPAFLNRYSIKGNGLAGCTIMGDGSISLILDVNNLLNNF
ncbi:MAG: chemotaxis protein CheA [Oscillospiraceae bacterium]|nr:chemotaxis protein CheA [Oscillospiraceae bacterium]